MTAPRTPWLNRSCACGLANDAHDDADYDEHGDCKRATGLGAQLAVAETTLEQTQALAAKQAETIERLTQLVRSRTVDLERERLAVSTWRGHAEKKARERDEARAELAILRNLAEQAMRGPSIEHRQAAANVICARLVRPPSEPTCRDPSCGNPASEEGALCKPCRDEDGGYGDDPRDEMEER